MTSTPLFDILTPPKRFEERIAGRKLAVAFGGGLNSVALGIELVRRGIRPECFTMADTGGELPETWELVERFSQWLLSHGFPEVSVVRYRSKKHGDTSLEQECLRTKSLPSKAYGWSTCSEKWKARPQNAFLRLHEVFREEWRTGRKAIKLIGFDAGESRRVKYPVESRWENEYPLVEWGIFRENCQEIAASEGFSVPKSSCFFCPSMRKSEIASLAKTHPELMSRALAMEDLAKPGLLSVKGLGRAFSWRELLFPTAEPDLFSEPPEQDCGCYDG